MSRRRAFVVVIDACGAGALPDAAQYGDEGTNTLVHLAEAVGGLRLPTLERLGLGSILAIDGVAPAPAPVCHGRLHALGPGKDSTTGHWELMGVVPRGPMPTYPGGFPDDVVAAIERATGRAVICNRPYNGIDVIADFGDEHVATGGLIVYTSQDSVLQIAAHTAVVGLEELYRDCHAVRELMAGEHAVGRVIARPFAGEAGAFERIPGRRDLALPPPGRSYLQELQDVGVAIHGIGKVAQLFSGVGFDRDLPGGTNTAALGVLGELVATLDAGLVFCNLVDTDQVYGHRKDVDGFHLALQEIDAAVAGWLERLGPGDLLVLTADHGCDPAHAGSDHTREHAPLLASFHGHGGARHDGPLADVGASVLRWLAGRDAPDLPGSPFV